MTDAGVTTRAAAELTGVAQATAARPASSPRRSGPRTRLANRFTAQEGTRVREVLNSAEFVNRAPLQIYATLFDRGRHLSSVSTMYRVLAAHAQVFDRRAAGSASGAGGASGADRDRPGAAVHGGMSRNCAARQGTQFDAYVLIDIYSATSPARACASPKPLSLAEDMTRAVFTIHSTPLVVHADRGTSMTCTTVAALLTDVSVVRSHSRPRVSNDTRPVTAAA